MSNSGSRAGRQRDAIWDDFEGLPATSKQKATRAKCKACDKDIQGLVQRLKKSIMAIFQLSMKGNKEIYVIMMCFIFIIIHNKGQGYSYEETRRVMD